MMFINNVALAFAGIIIGYRGTQILYGYWIKFCNRFFGLSKSEKEKIKRFKKGKKIYREYERRISKMSISAVKEIYICSWETYLEQHEKGGEEALRIFYILDISGKILVNNMGIRDDITAEELYDLIKNNKKGGN